MEDKRKPRILHVLKSSIYSGAENVVITIINNLKEDYEFLYLATDGAIRDRLEQEHIPFLLLKKFNRSGLRHAILDWKPDIVHAHDFSATVLCASVPGQFRLISHLHYDPPWVKSWNIKTMAYALCGRRIREVLTVSDKIFQSMIFAEIFQNKCRVIGNPIDVNNIRRMAESETGEKAEAECDLLFAGRFVEQKNPQRFIRLVLAMKQGGWDSVCAWMLGDGELFTECEELVEELGLRDNIILMGFQENPYAYMKSAKVLCLTSRWEGYGLVALEASALGIPVLSTKNAGCTEILGETAEELCDTDEQFAEKIDHICKNTEVYETWRARSLKRAAQFDNVEKYMTNLSSIYRNEVLKW